MTPIKDERIGGQFVGAGLRPLRIEAPSPAQFSLDRITGTTLVAGREALVRHAAWLAPGGSYVAQDYTGLAGTGDSDGDGQPESIDIHVTVDERGVETMTVPAGTFSALKMRSPSLYRFTNSADASTLTTTASTADWYAADIFQPHKLTIQTTCHHLKEGLAPRLSKHRQAFDSTSARLLTL